MKKVIVVLFALVSIASFAQVGARYVIMDGHHGGHRGGSRGRGRGGPVYDNGHRGGGDSGFVTGLTGGLVGGMLAGGKKSDGVSRAEVEAGRAQDKADQLARQQQQSEMQQLRTQIAQKKAAPAKPFIPVPAHLKTTPMYLWPFWFIMFILFLAILFTLFGLGISNRRRDK